MGIFKRSDYSPDEIKKLIMPTVEFGRKAIEAFEDIEISPPPSGFVLLESESKVLNELREVTTKIYLYYGLSTAQVIQIGNYLEEKKISTETMTAVNKSFMYIAEKLKEYEIPIHIALKDYGLTHIEAIKFHEKAWFDAVELRPIEMEKLKSIRKERMHWDWINLDSWARLNNE
jgi:hypothetical protein